MTTAGERLLQLAGSTGTAASLLLSIGAGATTGAALVNYSGLISAPAAAHLLIERSAVSPAPTFGMGGQRIYSGCGAGRSRYKRDEELIWMTRGGR